MSPDRKNRCANSCTLSDEELYKLLSPEQYRIVRENGTEQPFENAYWNNKEPGIYVDIVSGEALFSSLDKFDSGTGWPSFTKPLKPDLVIEREDRSLSRIRTEVRSRTADSHLGHVFDDGPAPTGRRYCINSAALRFIPANRLAEEGYGQFASLFETTPSSEVNKAAPARTETAIFGAGCFWGVEDIFAKKKGVLHTEVGYAGGTKDNPSYEEVKTGTTGHAESVRIEYDPAAVSYEDLVRIFFAMHDPTTLNRQGPDRGTQYRSIIFYASPEQQCTAEKVKEELASCGAFSEPIVTEIAPAKKFWRAEEYHQKYFEKHGGSSCHT